MERLWLPLLIPIGAIIATFFVVFTISRILLFVPREVAVPLALVMALLVLGGAAFVASTSKGGARGSLH